MSAYDSYIFDRKKQKIWTEGRCYTPAEIRQILLHTPAEYQAVMQEVCHFLTEWFDDSPCLQVQTSGSTGTPHLFSASKDCMMESARMTCSFLELHAGDTALLCMPLKYIGAKMMVVRALITGMNLIVRPPSGHPLSDVTVPLRFAAMVPFQVFNTLQIAREEARLKQIGILLIGGSPIDRALENTLALFPNRIYSTYGMTETLSHIALRPLNGELADGSYTPFPTVTLTTDADGCLQIHAPAISSTRIQTQDIVDLFPDNRFVIKGRKNNIINSGGIKIQIETVEQILSGLLSSPFAVTAAPDPGLGEQVVLLTENREEVIRHRKEIVSSLPRYHAPRQIIPVDHIPKAGNRKIDRCRCQEIAIQYIRDL